MINIQNYIDGQLYDPIDQRYLDVWNPSNGKIYAKCPNSNNQDLKFAISSAKNAFNDWSNLNQNDRSDFLISIAKQIQIEHKKFAKAESIDNGKPYSLSEKLDIPRSIKNLEFFSKIANEAKNDIYHQKDIISHIIKQPLGIVGTISPWNLPLYLFTWKIAPALVTGNCVIAKPSEITPYTAYLFAKACIKAKLPKGVLNILHGKGTEIGEHIVKNNEIKAISFTGGTTTGKEIAIKASQSLKKISLEMGGKNPVLIFNDCNYEKMINSLIKSSFLNQGQICLAGSRIYVQNKIYSQFKKDFVEKVNKLITGDPFDSKTDQGAIVSIEHLNKIDAYVKHAKKNGGKILTGGEIKNIDGKCSSGWYYKPTVIEGLSQTSKVNQEEIFGPVVTLNRFDNDNDAIEMANNTSYGLASIIWTEDINKAHKLAELVESGLVWVNCWLERDLRTPFGGIKNSGFGKEGGKYAIDFFTQDKNICTKYYD
tara:strand:- start:15631 stop:17076 length:1446 start_codon:yes stop_codon:yes gene_type:complete